jgi:apolipoprotein N-acyltransferase
MVATYREPSVARAFATGLSGGLVFFIGTCYWITNVLRNYGDLSWTGAVLLFTLLAVYLALYYGVFTVAFARLSSRAGLLCFWMAPAIWVGTEYLRGLVFTGFPWCLLGYALADYTNLAQLASWTGVYGLSFVALAVNAGLAALIVSFGKQTVYQFGLTLLALSALSFGWTASGREVLDPVESVRIVQTNIDLDQKWDLESKLAVLNELTTLSNPKQALQSNGETNPLILWPETPAPFYFNHDPDFRHRVRDIAVSSKSYLLFGFVDFKRSSSQLTQGDPYNSVGLISPQGEFVAQYDKIHLVPFGEYVPYSQLFLFVEKISTEAGNFKPGSRVVVSPMQGGHRLGSFICYEAVVPDLIRQFSKQGAEVFVNVTNDGWFGESAAPFQHLLMARMRAIENHRYLLRAANNGISAIVDPYGRVLKSIERNRRMVLDGKFGFETVVTPYVAFGDVFVWLCFAATGIAFINQPFRTALLRGRRRLEG